MKKSILGFWRDLRKATRQGPAAIEQRQRARLSEMVAFARANSPYYKELYKDVPEHVDDVTLLPVTNKPELMSHFDDWVTDRGVNIEDVRAFVENPKTIGELYRDKYIVANTTGTTGKYGIFLIDEKARTVNFAIVLQTYMGWFSFGDFIKILAHRGHFATIAATGGHFLSSSGGSFISKSPLSSIIKIFSAHKPIPELVDGFNKFDPAIIFGYGSLISLLASEQEAGRLKIHPVLVEDGGETLTEGERNRIAKLFKTKVYSGYGSTECPFLSFSCKYGWYHVNTDWAVLEPVDSDYKPVPPGELSHTVLISNLANQVQPILRYDLGDQVIMRPDPCPCGNPHPAIRVQGRTADTLTFLSEQGKQVEISPLAFETFLEHPGIDLFQIVQITSTSLSVRLLPKTGMDPDVLWIIMHKQITNLLTAHKLDNVTVKRADELPEQTSGGKYRAIIPLGVKI